MKSELPGQRETAIHWHARIFGRREPRIAFVSVYTKGIFEILAMISYLRIVLNASKKVVDASLKNRPLSAARERV